MLHLSSFNLILWVRERDGGEIISYKKKNKDVSKIKNAKETPLEKNGTCTNAMVITRLTCQTIK